MRYAGSTHTYRAVPQSPPAGSRRWVMCRGMCQWSEVLQLCNWALSRGHKKTGLSGAMQGGVQIDGDIQGWAPHFHPSSVVYPGSMQGLVSFGGDLVGREVWCVLGGFGGTPGLG